MSTISQQVTPPQGPHANDELLTIAEVADVLRVPIAPVGCKAKATAPPPHESSASERECRSDVLRRGYEHSCRGCRAAGQPRGRGGSPGLIGGQPSGVE